MSQQKSFSWNRINMLASEIKLPEWDHNNEEAAFIKYKYREARKNWKSAKRHAPELRMQHLKERADEHAKKDEHGLRNCPESYH
jgi:hypothetical protein